MHNFGGDEQNGGIDQSIKTGFQQFNLFEIPFSFPNSLNDFISLNESYLLDFIILLSWTPVPLNDNDFA